MGYISVIITQSDKISQVQCTFFKWNIYYFVQMTNIFSNKKLPLKVNLYVRPTKYSRDQEQSAQVKKHQTGFLKKR